MGIQGTGLTDKNTRLRFFSLVFMGIIAFGAVLYWRHTAITTSEYAEPPIRHQAKNNTDALRSANYELDVIETSPSVK